MRFLRALVKTAKTPSLFSYYTSDFKEDEDPAEGAWKPALVNTALGGYIGAMIGGLAHGQHTRNENGVKVNFNPERAVIGGGIGAPLLGLITYLAWQARKRKNKQPKDDQQGGMPGGM